MDPKEREDISRIKLSSSLSTILKDVHGGQLEMNANSLRIFAKFMERFNKKLLDAFSTHAADSNSMPLMSMDAAFKAVNETIPGKNLQELAILEGQKQVHLYKSGIMLYNRDEPLNVKKKRNRNVILVSPFSYVPSVAAVFDHLFPENKVCSDVEKTVADWISKLSRGIAQKCCDLAGGDAVTPTIFKQAIDDMLPSELAKLANVVGVRHMLMFERGHLSVDFSPDSVQGIGSWDSMGSGDKPPSISTVSERN